VFGAGASYDSNPYHPAGYGKHSGWAFEENRLPLANELFSDRRMFNEMLARFPQCHPVIPHLLHGSIEEKLQNFLDKGDKDEKRFQQLAAIRYYLHVMIWECERLWLDNTNHITNHITLLDILRQREKDGVCLVTFNYDRIIERALQTVGVQIADIPDFIADKYYKLIKLHGSVDWAHVVSELDADRYPSDYEVAHELISRAKALKFTDEYVMVRSIPMGIKDLTLRQGLFPAIAIPVLRKNEFECPSSHLDALKDMIPLVDRLLIIGWRATEEHFLKLLTSGLNNDRHSLRCMVVAESMKSAQLTIDNLNKAGIKADYEMNVVGFSAFVVSDEAETFINP